MLAAIKEMASYKDEINKACHLETYKYLDACNKLFERGILSHELINSLSSPVLENMTEGFSCFERWHQVLCQNETGLFSNISSSNNNCSSGMN
jgi:hypothetical protein